MNQNNYHIKKRMSPIETALIGNLIYVVLVLIFKGILDLMGNDGNYGIVFGAVEFVLTAAYWIGLNWFLFRNPASHQDGSYGRYVLFSLLPILVFTIISSVVIYTAPGTEFTSAWNQFTFLVAPTIFWYLPFGIIYNFIGSYLPIVAYFGLCLLMVIIFQVIGISLGAGRRKALRERAQKRSQQLAREEAITVEKVVEPFNKKRRQQQAAQTAEVQPKPERKAKKRPEQPKPRKINPKDPFDEGEQTQIIYTETFSAITDEMIEAVENQKRERLENRMASVVKPSVQTEEMLDRVEMDTKRDLMKDIDIESVSGAIRETRRGLKETQKAAPPKQEPERLLDKEKSETRDISEELQNIRRMMSQDKTRKRK